MSVPQADFNTDERYAGFRCRRVVSLADLRVIAYDFEHEKTGARLLHLHTDDIENCFAVIFPTPPPDESGLPHILEHSVLAGSEKYPVREPFFELVKMSMATFINAYTAQCFTAYPVCSTVEADFFNLMDVYMDATFHPQLTEGTFKREGHHLALKDNSDLSSDLIISGIVYSEMKGYWSTPDNMLSNLGTRGLFPDTPLGHDSGGNPKYIPELSYAQFREFYADYYHPSNAHFFVYGNIDTRKHLDYLAPLLDSYERKEIQIDIPRQPRWSRPRFVEDRYPVGGEEDAAERSYVVMNWLVGDATDPASVTAWSVLSSILLGHDAAPLKKAIIDSGLGADTYGGGDFAHAHELVFDVGLQGASPENSGKFEELVLDKLREIAAVEITPEMVDTALHQEAYHMLEVEKNFPLKLLWLCGESWPYAKDPLNFMRMQQQLKECRAAYENDARFFNRMIEEGLLNNNHRVTVAIHPEAGLEARREAEFAAVMRERKARMSREELEKIALEAAELAEEQTRANSPEQLASLPQLGVDDLPDKPREIPTAIEKVAGVTLLRNDVFANGVNYFNVAIDLAGLPEELYPYLSEFSRAITKMGTIDRDFAATAELRASVTGNLQAHASLMQPVATDAAPLRHILVGMKTIDEKAGAALGLLQELLFSVDPRDTERLKDILTQRQAALRNELVNNALSAAIRRAGRSINSVSALSYQLGSQEALARLTRQLNAFETEAEIIMASIERIRDFIRDPARWTVSFTGSDAVYAELKGRVKAWSGMMNNAPVPDRLPDIATPVAPAREGLAAPIKVAHCAKVMPAPAVTDPASPLYELGLYLANFDYLLPEIRFKGNAYGAGSQYNPQQGTLILQSFNDPHIVETLDVFDGLREFVAGADWTQTDINRAIIGSAKKISMPIRPAEATLTALTRHLSGLSDELRAERYQIGRGATPETVRQVLLRELDRSESHAGVCVAASRENLAKANAVLGEHGLAISDILG